VVIINSQNDLEKVFDSLVHIGKLKHDKRHEELTALASSVIALGAYLSASEIPWPKPADGLGIVLVEILEWGQKLWLTQWYFARNPYPPKKKPDQIEDELARELDPERTALAEEIERKTIETERHTHAAEQVLYSSRLNSQLRTMAQWPEKRLREIQLRGFEIIREMIDPKPTAELDAHAEKLATPPAVAAEMPTANLDAPAVPIVSEVAKLPPLSPETGCTPLFDGKPTKAKGRILQVMSYFMTRHSATFDALKEHLDEQVEDTTVHTCINRTNLALDKDGATWRLKADLRKVVKVQIP